MPGTHLMHGAAEKDRLPGGIAFDRALNAPPFEPAALDLHADLEIQRHLPFQMIADGEQQLLPGAGRQIRLQIVEPGALDRRRPVQTPVKPRIEPDGAVPQSQFPYAVAARRRFGRSG